MYSICTRCADVRQNSCAARSLYGRCVVFFWEQPFSYGDFIGMCFLWGFLDLLLRGLFRFFLPTCRRFPMGTFLRGLFVVYFARCFPAHGSFQRGFPGAIFAPPPPPFFPAGRLCFCPTAVLLWGFLVDVFLRGVQSTGRFPMGFWFLASVVAAVGRRSLAT